MSTATLSPAPGSPGSPSLRRKKMLKKLTVSTDAANEEAADQLPTMARMSPTTTSASPRKGNDMLRQATRARAASNAKSPKVASESKRSAEKDLSKLASPATPSRSHDRKHVDNAIISKLQKLGMQEGKSSVGSRGKVATPKPNRPRLAVVLDMDECMLHTTCVESFIIFVRCCFVFSLTYHRDF